METLQTVETLDEAIALGEQAFTRRLEQPTLDPVLFPAVRTRDVHMIKVAISGTIEVSRAQLDELLSGGGATLDAGAVVLIAASGYVVQPGAAWVKRREKSEQTGEAWEWWEKEGRIKVKLTDLARLELNGETWSE